MSRLGKYSTMRTKLERVLEAFPETRDSDSLLCVRVVQSMGGKSIEDLEMINVNTVVKLRQYLQNKEGKYLPTEETRKYREEQKRSKELWTRNKK